MSQLSEALSQFDEQDYTVKLCRTVFGALPTAPPFAFYRDLAGGIARVAESPRPDLIPRAAVLADRREAERALWLAGALDKADKGLAMASGVSNLVAFIRGSSSESRSTFESDKQQAIDAGIKLLGLAYIASRLFTGGPTEKVEQLLRLPAGREAALYLATVEIALPFMDNFLETGGSVISNLLNSSAVEAAARFGGVAGRATTEEATSVLAHLVEPLERLLEGVKHNVGQVFDTIRSHVPAALGVADSATGMLATTMDAMPVWQFLGARLVAEACALRALAELPEPAASLPLEPTPVIAGDARIRETSIQEGVALEGTARQATDGPLVAAEAVMVPLPDAAEAPAADGATERIGSGAVSLAAAAIGTAGVVAGSRSLLGAPTAAPLPTEEIADAPSVPRGRPMTRTYVRFLLLLAGAVGGAVLVRAYPDVAWNQLDWVRAQPQWMFAGFTGLLGLVMFRLGVDLAQDWPVALGATIAAGSLAAGVALAGSRRFIIAGYADSPYMIPVGLLLVLLVIGIVRLRGASIPG